MTEETKNKKEVRQRSTIQFPYADLDSVISIAGAIHKNAGHGECDKAQIAAWTDHSAKSSGFDLKLSAAKMFDIIDSVNGKYQLTDLGKKIVDPNEARAAKVDAFLSVPLYKSVFTTYNGSTLPPSTGLEADIVNMGVATKVKDRARQYLERSAEQAGFFETGKNRLVRPSVQQFGGSGGGTPPPPEDRTPPPPPPPPSKTKTFHPFIDGLLEELPAKGQPWSQEEQTQWLDTAKSIFGMIYKDNNKQSKKDEDENPLA